MRIEVIRNILKTALPDIITDDALNKAVADIWSYLQDNNKYMNNDFIILPKKWDFGSDSSLKTTER